MHQRRHDLDWVRILAFGVLVVYHVGMYYVSWDWHVDSPHAVPALEPLMRLSSPWRLSLLFLVSGTATAFLLARLRERSGSGVGFLGSRSWRLLLPLAFGMLVIVPPQAYFELLGSGYPGGYHDGYLAFWGRYLQADGSFCDDKGCLLLPTWNHLWFVAYLWAYTVMLWLLLRLAPRALSRLGGCLGVLLSSGTGLLLGPALVLALARMLLIGRFEPTHALVDDWYNHVQYFFLFLLGYLIATDARVWDRIEATRWPALALALAGYGFITLYFGHYVEIAPSSAMRQAQRAAWAVNQWATIIAILGFARRLVPGDGPARRYLTGAVFPVYILHQTVTVALAWNLRPLALPPALEGPLLVVLTFGLSLAGYECVRRVGWLRPLFGLRPRQRRPADARPLAKA